MYDSTTPDAPPSEDIQARVAELVTEADLALLAGDFAKAAAHLEDALVLLPVEVTPDWNQRADLSLCRADFLSEDGQHALAVDLAVALAQEHHAANGVCDAWLHARRAEALFHARAGDDQAARRVCEEAFRIASEHADELGARVLAEMTQMLASQRARAGALVEAIDVCDEMASFLTGRDGFDEDPDLPLAAAVVLETLGRVCLDVDDEDGAIDNALDRSAPDRSAPDRSAPDRSAPDRSVLERGAAALSVAVRFYEMALGPADPAVADTWLAVAEVMERMGKDVEAEEARATARDLGATV